MRLYCINLDRRPDRLAIFHDVNRDLRNLTRFPALDGQTLDPSALAQRGLVDANIRQFWTPGALGCALSHAALWDEAIRHGEPITICEDDAIFNAHFDGAAAKVIATLPPDWDIIAWGWNFDLFIVFEMLPGVSSSLSQFEQQRMRDGAAAFRTQEVDPRAFRLSWAFGTPGYAVSPKGAAVLKERLLPYRFTMIPYPEGVRAAPYSMYHAALSVDCALNRVYRDINAFVCFPPLVITKNQDTDVQTR